MGGRSVQVDGAAGIADHDGRKSETACVESRVAYAVVVGQARKKDAREAALLQIAGQARPSGAVVLEEGRIGINLSTESFAQNELGLRKS